MPELPEVETVCRGLAAHIAGKTIAGLDVFRHDLRYPLPKRFAARLRGRRIRTVSRRAKYILIALDHDLCWITHLGMSGSLTYRDAPPPAGVGRKHDHLRLHFTDGATLTYHDPRRFGFMDLIPAAEQPTHRYFRHLGVEPLDDGFTGAFLHDAFQRRSGPIKTVVMDQKLVVGIGNIYASEALFRSRIHPQTPARQLSPEACKRLAAAIQDVLRDAICAGGSTLRDYRRSSGEAGYFQHAFAIYGKEGEPCTRCGALIRRIVQAGRSTFYCPKCQSACAG